MQAILQNYRQSPRKVRLVADMVRGKSVNRAIKELTFLSKRASGQIEKLIMSAVANAEHNDGLKKDDLVVANITVDKGPTLKRSMPRAMGRAFPINKRTSIVKVTLAKKQPKKEVAPVEPAPKKEKVSATKE
ncbi:MAG: 50S ribosomal protein L22 [Candidatus Yonathbacteria bacterium]|nr:50S ribosomal protein L22 [Candidatus Yonathbacteria bacterium]NTW47526.1 50S ribosomal protein L22 [Candidatus Yonathbacteria bacterium]